jgi:hypothetical protein
MASRLGWPSASLARKSIAPKAATFGFAGSDRLFPCANLVLGRRKREHKAGDDHARDPGVLHRYPRGDQPKRQVRRPAMSILVRAEYLLHGVVRGLPGTGTRPVRWWLTEADWRLLQAERAVFAIVPRDPRSSRLFGLPVTIDRFGQPSRLITQDGTAIPLPTGVTPGS